MDKICKQCGSKILTRDKRTIYCSRKCFTLYRTKNRICKQCGKEFSQRGHGLNFCNNKCYGKWRIGKFCADKHSQWKGGVTYTNGYRYIFLPNHPLANHVGYYMEHRYVMEQHIGRLLDKNKEVVHHIDGNKLNNKIENLKLTNRHDHFFMHVDNLILAKHSH